MIRSKLLSLHALLKPSVDATSWNIAKAIAAIFLAASGNCALGQAPPQPADQAAINSAIQRGVQYLRSSQNPSGSWGAGTKAGSDGGWIVGYSALAGVTLLECGVPPSDPGLQSALKGVRSFAQDLDNTYEVALAILFLDHMGDKNDKKLIQLLAGRLIVGQTPTGGWGYKVPKKTQSEVDSLLAAVRKLSPPQAPSGPNPRERPASAMLCVKGGEDVFQRPAAAFDADKARIAALASLPGLLKRLPLFSEVAQLLLEDPKDKGWDALNPTTDNSNTHFAMIALWASRKYDVPTDRSFAMLANRFRTSQGADGTWAYAYVRNGQNGGPPSMTCVALLGLAIGHVLNADAAVRPEKDPRVINAFSSLSKQIGEPAGRIDGRPTPESQGGLYFFWGMERIAVLYDVHQLDKKDWHQWGAEILLCHQKPEGCWEKGGYHGEHPILNTCFALLFLKRANLTPDLSRRLTVDTSALTQKVSDRNAPAIAPAKPPEPTPVVVETAPPPRLVEPKPKSDPTPVAVEPVVAIELPPQEKSLLPWILGGIGLLFVMGIGLFFLVRQKGDEDAEEEADDEGEEEDRPPKKSSKKAVASKGKDKTALRSKKTKPVAKRSVRNDD